MRNGVGAAAAVAHTPLADRVEFVVALNLQHGTAAHNSGKQGVLTTPKYPSFQCYVSPQARQS
jgi:hypothetical protein